MELLWISIRTCKEGKKRMHKYVIVQKSNQQISAMIHPTEMQVYKTKDWIFVWS